MLDWLTWLFDSDGFPARWYCGEGWTPWLGWLHILSDVAIWGAYTAIPLSMWHFARRRPDIRLPRVFWLYVAFILACGLVHLIEAGIFYWPFYRLSGLAKLVTAVVSIATVVAIVRVLPTALSLPGIAKMNATLKQEVTQREQAERQLEQANTALVSRNKELQRFLYSMSHDLKSPVVTTQGFAKYIRTDLEAGRHDRLDGWVQRIEEAAGSMTTTLEDLLVLGRLGSIQAQTERVELGEVVSEVVESAAPLINASDAHVEVHEPLPAVMGNREQLKRMVQNLIENALTHGQAPGRRLRIDVFCEREGGRARLCVADNGPGIAPEHAERVFVAFERLQNTTKGTGLGLSIVARIVQNHHGRIWVESAINPGDTTDTPDAADGAETGARFWIEFPAVDDESA